MNSEVFDANDANDANEEAYALDQLDAARRDLALDRVDAGECWYCGCTEDDACVVAMGDGAGITTCSWHRQPDHRGFGVCSNPDCVKAYLADPGAP